MRYFISPEAADWAVRKICRNLVEERGLDFSAQDGEQNFHGAFLN